MKYLHSLIVVCLTAVFMSSCGLPKEDRKRAEEAEVRLAATQLEVTKKRGQWQKQSEDPSSAFLLKYSQKEDWQSHFKKAEADAALALEILEKEIKPALKRNKKAEVEGLKTSLGKFDQYISSSKDNADVVHKRVTLLIETKANSPKIAEQATQQVADIKLLYDSITKNVEKAKKDFPDSEAIQVRYAPFTGMWSSTEVAMRRIDSELPKTKVEGSDVDYSLIADSAKVIEKIHADLQTKAPAFEKALSGLYKGYSKTLVDMRADRFVQIGRTSWNESSDANTEFDYVYANCKVDEATYDYFDGLPDDLTVMSLGSFGGGLKVDQNYWNKLNISEREGWPSGSHGHAEFWVHDTPEEYYHRYVIYEGVNKTETDWERVSAALFEEHEDDLGMTIISKPLGMFEDEQLAEAMPQGMAEVGNPKYGEWKQDATGTSFWQFYGQWAFMNAMLGNNHRYTRSEWDSWRTDYRGKQGYYGNQDKDGHTAYGTYSSRVQTDPRYTKSTFATQGGLKAAKSEVSAGKIAGRSADSSVRGAGPAKRGGGPGGGGK